MGHKTDSVPRIHKSSFNTNDNTGSNNNNNKTTKTKQKQIQKTMAIQGYNSRGEVNTDTIVRHQKACLWGPGDESVVLEQGPQNTPITNHQANVLLLLDYLRMGRKFWSLTELSEHPLINFI